MNQATSSSLAKANFNVQNGQRRVTALSPVSPRSSYAAPTAASIARGARVGAGQAASPTIADSRRHSPAPRRAAAAASTAAVAVAAAVAPRGSARPNRAEPSLNGDARRRVRAQAARPAVLSGAAPRSPASAAAQPRYNCAAPATGRRHVDPAPAATRRAYPAAAAADSVAAAAAVETAAGPRRMPRRMPPARAVPKPRPASRKSATPRGADSGGSSTDPASSSDDDCDHPLARPVLARAQASPQSRDSLDNSIGAMRDELDYDASFAESQENRAEVTDELAIAKAILRTALAEKAKVESENRRLTEANMLLTKNLEDCQAERAAMLRRHRHELETALTANKELTAANHALTDSCARAETVKTTLSTKLKIRHAEKKVLQAENASLTKANRELAENCELLSADLAACQAGIRALETELFAMQSMAEDHYRELIQAREDLDDTQQDIQSLEWMVKTRDETIERMRSNSPSLEPDRHDERSPLEPLQGTCDDYEMMLEELGCDAQEFGLEQKHREERTRGYNSGYGCSWFEDMDNPCAWFKAELACKAQSSDDHVIADLEVKLRTTACSAAMHPAPLYVWELLDESFARQNASEVFDSSLSDHDRAPQKAQATAVKARRGRWDFVTMNRP